jgi:hypothetical protein
VTDHPSRAAACFTLEFLVVRQVIQVFLDFLGRGQAAIKLELFVIQVELFSHSIAMTERLFK